MDGASSNDPIKEPVLESKICMNFMKCCLRLDVRKCLVRKRNGAIAEVGWERLGEGVEFGITNLITSIKAYSKLSAREGEVCLVTH